MDVAAMRVWGQYLDDEYKHAGSKSIVFASPALPLTGIKKNCSVAEALKVSRELHLIVDSVPSPELNVIVDEEFPTHSPLQSDVLRSMPNLVGELLIMVSVPVSALAVRSPIRKKHKFLIIC
jgi:hypothetical protein